MDTMYRLIGLLLLFVTSNFADNPCKAKSTSSSVVCVCNDNYCDDFTRDAPETGGYVAYTSSKSGSRFVKTTGTLQDNVRGSLLVKEITLNPNVTYQTMMGFGGAVTDSAGLNWKNLSLSLQDKLISAYFGEKGLDYNFIRVPIGGSDFSTHVYTYNELPENDVNLSNYTLAPEDFNYKIPMIAAAKAASKKDIDVLATCWSPPVWMKTNNAITGFSRLKDEHLQTYADYLLKFIELYNANNISIWGLTTTNEPFNGVIPVATFNSLGFSPEQMGTFIAEHLGPTIRNSSFSDIKILAVDDQRFTLPMWLDKVVQDNPDVLNWIDGVAVHWYGDAFTPASLLSDVKEDYPELFVLATEACTGSFPLEDAVELGSWSRAEQYIDDIITDFEHHVTGWIDWNLCLNEVGGPNWAGNNVDAPIIIDRETTQIYKQPMYYALGHFAKFVPKDSVRVEMDKSGSSIDGVAFATPRNTVVAVLSNKGNLSRDIALKLGEKGISTSLKAKSITTIEIGL